MPVERVSSRRLPPGAQRRPMRRRWSRSSCRAASTCSTRSYRCTTTGATRTSIKLKIAGVPRRRGFRRPPLARSGPRRRPQGPLRSRQDRLPAGHRLRQPGPVALPLAPLLGDRADHSRRRAGLARPLARPRGRARQPAAGPHHGLGALAGDALRARPAAAVSSPGDAGFWIRDVWASPTTRRWRPTALGRRRGGSHALRASRTAARLAKGVADRPTSRTASTRSPRRSPIPPRATSASGCATWPRCPAAARHPRRHRRRDARRLRHP